MFGIRVFYLVLTLAVASMSPAFAEQKIGVSEKAQLQASMQTYIDRRLVKGAYLSLDRVSGVVRELHPIAAHPIILKMGKYFILCSDFRDQKGNSVNIDFYLAPRGNRYVVFEALVDERSGLQRLMKAGNVSRVN
jgi:hypothetical protein